MRHGWGSREGLEASLVEGIVGGCLALGCSLALDSTPFAQNLLAAIAGHGAATTGATATLTAATAGSTAKLAVEQLRGGGR